MDHLHIEKIMEKYWTGESNLEEEEILKNYFVKEEIPQHLRIYRPLFQTYVHERNKKFLGAFFNKKILEEIENKKEAVGFNWQFFIKIAATILIILGVGLFFSKINTPHIQQDQQIAMSDTFEDPELAYEQAKIALGLFSSKLNKGTEKLAEISEFNRAQEIISNE